MSSIDWVRMWRPEQSPPETLIRAFIVYVAAHVAFRALGRRELRRPNMGAAILLFLVAVAFRQSIVQSDRSLTTAMLGFGTLVLVDAATMKLARLSPRLAKIIEGPVRELVRDGEVDDEQLRRGHISPEQLLAAVRERGGEDLSRVHRARLERSGKISVVFFDEGARRRVDGQGPRPALRRPARRVRASSRRPR